MPETEAEQKELGPSGAAGEQQNLSTEKSHTGAEKDAQPAKFLQLMATWLEGANEPRSSDDSLFSGWSARYSDVSDDEEDCPPALPPDLAPVLGLPQGTDKEELARIALEQEEDLLQQLIAQA